jgi:hypothetical protein
MTSPPARHQLLAPIVAAMQQASHRDSTWTHQQLRARAKRIHHQVIVQPDPLQPGTERDIDDYEAER